jgi:hypothetical protein
MPDEHARGRAVYDVRGSTWTSTVTCSQSLHSLFGGAYQVRISTEEFALGTGMYESGRAGNKQLQKPKLHEHPCRLASGLTLRKAGIVPMAPSWCTPVKISIQ